LACLPAPRTLPLRVESTQPSVGLLHELEQRLLVVRRDVEHVRHLHAVPDDAAELLDQRAAADLYLNLSKSGNIQT